ncbi:hypothetical protein L2D01_00270 [Hyphomonadaceae bacterium ML37]|nr:hypothetical protein L2D01_00270 [Hyphomonadaceae bacterium ML37]
MIDERLSFCDFISSDRTLHGSRRQKGDKITDLLMYEEGAILKSIDRSTLLIVEFKKPGRDDYKYGDSGKDPFHQVIETVKHIRQKNGLTADDGTIHRFPEGTNIIAFIIADITDKLSDIYDNHDMRRSWDHMGYFRYHKTYDVFIEAIGYDKLVLDAKKRNSAFFDILLHDLLA